jgi:DUF4097 and DUF4098 domain-containing protein YvlB
MRSRVLTAVIALFAATASIAAVHVDNATRELPIDPTGTVWVSNPYGSVDILGTDDNKVVVTVQRIINAADEQTAATAKSSVDTLFEGDSRVRLVKAIFPAVRDARWTSIVNINVRVPRTANVKVAGRAMDHIRVSQIAGSVTINAFSGIIVLSNISGPSTVETVNGRVIYDFPNRPTANARVQAINADIDIYAPRDSPFEWVAETLTGDLLSTFDVRGLYNGNVYKGRANNTGGPTFTTSSLAGRVMMLAKGTAPGEARPIVRAARQGAPGLLPRTRKVQIPFIYQQNWALQANVADVAIGEIHGAARIETGAGEVELGVVWGNLFVKSGGGPLKLGDMLAPIDVQTSAGDVNVRVARQGGSASTDGGIVRVMYAGGPMTLRSGGGDIVVQQTAAPIDAVTRSGDISITVSPTRKTERITAKTTQGSVALVVGPNFAADIDALLLTNDADTDTIRSDFNLTVRREAYNGKTRIRATGKINGGGERVELVAEDGSISISSQVISPMVIANPRQ